MLNEETIFAAALEKPHEERAAYLAEACGGDETLRRRLEGLLAASAKVGNFMANPAAAQSLDPSATQALSARPAGGSTGQDATAENCDEEPLTFLAPSSRPDALGRLGHYEMLEVLGKGGFGIVFRAFDDVLQRVVAIKVMAPQIATTSPARKRFLREAQSSAKVRHEHVVQVYEVGEQPLPYLVMEFIPGETLQQKLDRCGPLDVAETLRIGRQIAEGLAAAHACDLIHRDIKPGNILLEGGSHKAKITDFGLARAADDASISQSGIIAGTPMFMSPEQALGHHVDQRADLFSLGSVLYQMASGRPPFRAPSALAVLKRVAEEPPRPIPEIIPETPDWLCGIIAKLHAKNPDDRFQSAREVADVLADCEAKLKAKQAVKNILPASPIAVKPPGRKWAALAVVLFLPLLAVIALAVTEFAGVTHLFRGQQGTPDSKKLSSEPVTPAKKETLPPPAKPEVVHRIPWHVAEQGISAYFGETGISSDGRLFFAAGDTGPRGAIRVWELASGKQVQELVRDGETWQHHAQFLPGSNYLLASYARDKDIFLWDVGSGQVTRKFVGHDQTFPWFVVSPDGKRLLSWNEDKTIRLWDVDTGKELKKLEGHTEKGAGVFSPDSKQVLTFSPDKTLRLWSVDTGKELKKLEGHTEAPIGCFSPDGKQALSYSSDGTIRLWNLETGEEVRQYGEKRFKMSSEVAMWAAGFVAGGQHVFATTGDLKFRVYELASGKAVCEIDGAEVGKMGWNVAPSPDGKLALVGHDYWPVKVIDLQTGKEIHRYTGCRFARAFSFSPDGTMAVAGSFRNGVFVFRLPPAPTLQTAPPPTSEVKMPPTAVGPFTDADVKRIAALPASAQLDAVAEELARRNPGLDVTTLKASAQFDDGKLLVVEIKALELVDLSPLRALPAIPTVRIHGTHEVKLATLAGATMEHLSLNGAITDLSELPRLPALKALEVQCPTLTDITPLKGWQLRLLNLHYSKVEDLSPLKGMPLIYLNIHRTKVKDLSPLTGMKLETILYMETEIQDISVLRDMPLKAVRCDYLRQRDEAVLKAIRTLETINGKSVADFWKEVKDK